MREEIVFVGRGGQGILLAGEIFANTSFLLGKKVAETASYGSEARGEKSVSEVVISDEDIDFPGAMTPNVLVAMSQRGYNAWIPKVSSETKVLFDVDTVENVLFDRAEHIPIPATKTANRIGSRLSANMVMLGAVAAITGLIPIDKLFDVVKEETGRFADINLEATKKGYKLGKKYLMQKKVT